VGKSSLTPQAAHRDLRLAPARPAPWPLCRLPRRAGSFAALPVYFTGLYHLFMDVVLLPAVAT
jgi:hypothetical protein